MNKANSAHRFTAFLGEAVGFSLLLLIPSAELFQKYLGLIGVIGYMGIAIMLLWTAYRPVSAKFASMVTDKQTLWLMVATILLLLVVFSVIYPIANTAVPGKGSDRDEALNTATMELLHRRYPYYRPIYSGNPITPLPGAMLLATPFVLVGNSAYQNFFWLFVFFLTMSLYLKDKRSALLMSWTVLILCPVVLYEVVTGGDLLANSIYVLIFVMWLFGAVQQPKFPKWGKNMLAILLGIGLASRANYLLILPLIFAALVHVAGWSAAMKYMALTCVTFGLLVLPFYYYDPQGFSPLHTTTKFDQFEAVLPYAGIVVPAAAGIVAFVLSIWRTDGSLRGLLKNCAVVLAIPILCVTVLQSIQAGQPWFVWTGLGLSFVFFGAAAFTTGHFSS